MASYRVFLFAIAMIAVLAGCATTVRGAPDPPFGNDTLSTIVFKPGDAQALIDAPDTDTRNKMVTHMMAVIDIRYSAFRRNFAANGRDSKAGSEAAVLVLNTIGGLVDAKAAKDNFIAATALVTGGTNIFDRNFLYEKTVSALVAEMDANRKQKRVEIQTAMLKEGIDNYPGLSALNDVIDYYNAGSLLSAVLAIQKEAATNDATATEHLRKLSAASDQEILATQSDTAVMSARVRSLGTTDLAALAGFLAGKGYPPASQKSQDELNKLRDLRTEKYDGRFGDLMKDLDAVIPPTKK